MSGVKSKSRKLVMARDEHTCQIRGTGCTIDAEEVDHVVPREAGGTDDLDNLRAVCRPCHYRRKAQPKWSRNWTGTGVL